MKRDVLIKKLLKAGCVLKRHGNRHDIYMNTKNGKQAPVPRHSEIKDGLVRLIQKQLEVDER
ncbi:MAG: type II toxin-antitoxin system HicA family toxin [Chitinispirillaceae bacterium]